MDEELRKRLAIVGDVIRSVEIDQEFWDPKNPMWQNTNNHAMLMLRTYYYNHEFDDEFKHVFGGMIDGMVWLYVTHPEWRARLGWITWFLQMYVLDRQIIQEDGVQIHHEVWNDPRKWRNVNPNDTTIKTTVERLS